MELNVGIDKIGFYVPQYYVEMADLAQARGIHPEKLIVGIGQDRMAVPPISQDVVSMAANAANAILDDEDRASIDQIIFATESGFDYSKSGASFLHELLGIQPYCRAYEIKQACYGATAGIQTACDYIRLRPERKVLVIASDIARYGLNTAGEPTQGAGAVAMLLSANPRILVIESQSVSYTTHQFDFWRPSYSSVALVDGKFSTQLYQDAFVRVVTRYLEAYPDSLTGLDAMVLHLPFTKMGRKALEALAQSDVGDTIADTLAQWQSHYEASTYLGRQVGNIYTGSLYLSLLSLLTQDMTLVAGNTIGLFSYGSGAVAELLVGQLQAGYQAQVVPANVAAHLARREALSISAYEKMFQQTLPVSDDTVEVPAAFETEPVFYLDKVTAHQRHYTKA